MDMVENAEDCQKAGSLLQIKQPNPWVHPKGTTNFVAGCSHNTNGESRFNKNLAHKNSRMQETPICKTRCVAKDKSDEDTSAECKPTYKRGVLGGTCATANMDMVENAEDCQKAGSLLQIKQPNPWVHPKGTTNFVAGCSHNTNGESRFNKNLAHKNSRMQETPICKTRCVAKGRRLLTLEDRRTL